MEQAQSMTAFWSAFNEASKTLWDQWLTSAPKGADMGEWQQLEQRFRAGAEFGEQVTGQLLQLQHEWLQLLRQATESNALLPQPVQDMAKANVTLMDEMIDARARMWQQWFEQARSVELNRIQQAQPLLTAFGDAWRKAGQQASELMSAWAGAMNARPRNEGAVQEAADAAAKRPAREPSRKSA